jgi:hypothetical protein
MFGPLGGRRQASASVLHLEAEAQPESLHVRIGSQQRGVRRGRQLRLLTEEAHQVVEHRDDPVGRVSHGVSRPDGRR